MPGNPHYVPRTYSGWQSCGKSRSYNTVIGHFSHFAFKGPACGGVLVARISTDEPVWELTYAARFLNCPTHSCLCVCVKRQRAPRMSHLLDGASHTQRSHAKAGRDISRPYKRHLHFDEPPCNSDSRGRQCGRIYHILSLTWPLEPEHTRARLRAHTHCVRPC